MPLTVEEFFAEYKESANELWDKTPISVMVLGPNTDGNKLGSQLRKYIIDKCRKNGMVVRTEHKDFIDIHRKILGPNRNLCFMELKAAQHVDAIIMIPDSPGSFVELGMFSPFEDIRKRTIIVFKDKYSSPDAQKSFVFFGPKLAYSESGAPIEYINYRNKKLIWQKVNSFLHEKRANKYENNIIRKLIP